VGNACPEAHAGRPRVPTLQHDLGARWLIPGSCGSGVPQARRAMSWKTARPVRLATLEARLSRLRDPRSASPLMARSGWRPRPPNTPLEEVKVRVTSNRRGASAEYRLLRILPHRCAPSPPRLGLTLCRRPRPRSASGRRRLLPADDKRWRPRRSIIAGTGHGTPRSVSGGRGATDAAVHLGKPVFRRTARLGCRRVKAARP
jgi:hypothetical protein